MHNKESALEVNGQRRVKDFTYNEVLTVYARPHMTHVAYRYSANMVDLEFDDLYQTLSLKLWDHYKYWVSQEKDICLSEFLAIFRTASINACIDLQRKYIYTGKRAGNKVVSLASIEDGDDNNAYVEQFADGNSMEFLFDMTLKEIVDEFRSILSDMEFRLLQELVFPSVQLQDLMREEHKRHVMTLLHIQNNTLSEMDRRDVRMRYTVKITTWHLSRALNVKQCSIEPAYNHLLSVVSTQMAKRGVYHRRNTEETAERNFSNWCSTGVSASINV